MLQNRAGVFGVKPLQCNKIIGNKWVLQELTLGEMPGNMLYTMQRLR